VNDVIEPLPLAGDVTNEAVGGVDAA